MAGDDDQTHVGDAAGSGETDSCPPWCRRCGDSVHRGDLVTVGAERTGWLSVQLVADRYREREPLLKVDATHYGETQTVLLSAGQVVRLADAVAESRRAGQPDEPPSDSERKSTPTGAGWPCHRLSSVRAGTPLVLFGGVVEVIGVDDSPAFPAAQLLRVKPLDGEGVLTVLVPVDPCPLVVDR